jgi:hypothetical protein
MKSRYHWATRSVKKDLLYQQTSLVINKNADFPLFYLRSPYFRINLFNH